MGIAKNQSVIGEYNFYTIDTDQFCIEVGKLFKVNINVSYFEFFEQHEPPKSFDFGYSQSFNLSIVVNVEFDEFGNELDGNFISYELLIPVELKDEKELRLEFLPNGIFSLHDLPFSGKWVFFIYDLMGSHDSYYPSHQAVVDEILEIRSCYVSILQKIGCSQGILWTDAYYKTEEEFLFNNLVFPCRKVNLQEIATYMKEVDGITLYNFMSVVRQEIKLYKSFDSGYTDVAFLDNIGDTMLINDIQNLNQKKN